MTEMVVVSPFLRVLVQRLKSLAGNLPISVPSSLVEGLEDLAEIIDADTRSQSTVNLIIRRFQPLVFEVDNLLDEVQLESHQLQLPGRGVSLCFNPFSKQSKLAKALQDSLRTLQEESIELRKLSLRYFGKLTSVSQGTKSHPYLGRSKIIGREMDKERIAHSLFRNAGGGRVDVAAIFGMEGIGKTSVAQLIYNDPSLCSKFDIRLWVNVGREGDIFDVVVQIGMQALEEYELRFDPGLMTLEEMKMELYGLLSNISFLLVLDDVWSEELLPTLFRDLTDISSKGGAVIVTTCLTSVATQASPNAYLHQLDCLTMEDSYQLFKEYAFASNRIETRPNFEAIARKIVMQCQGHPLCLTMAGTYLYNKDTVQQWAELLDAQFMDPITFCVFFADKLPSYLKLPFCTFSLQEDSSVEELICIWMALGFVYSDDTNRQPEYIGRRYLEELAGSGLCTDVEYAPGGAVGAIKMHDIVHDIARKKAHEQGFRSDRIDGNARYLCCGGDHLSEMDLLKNAHDAKKLRLFILDAEPGDASVRTLREILSCFKCLRVLGLGGCDIEMLPDSIGQLKHLRYLDVGRNARMTTLPDSICNMWFLQTLLLHGCDQLQELPLNIGRLQNLRYLTLTTLQESLPEEIGQLTSLRTLGLASCRNLTSLPCSIKNLTNLQTLGIADCQEMDLAAASSAQGFGGMSGIDTLLIAGLPKFELLPTDLGAPSVVMMKHLLVQSCEKLTQTAWINQFRFLHSLTIEGCPELSDLATDVAFQFSSLVELVLRDCPRLGNTRWIRQFVALRSLIIDLCLDLLELDTGFAEVKSLERLEIIRCPHLSVRCESPDGEDWPHIAHVQQIELDGTSLKP